MQCLIIKNALTRYPMKEKTNMNMENMHLGLGRDKAGILLCTSGSRELLINGQLYHIREGMLCYVSPLLSFCELSRDGHYAEEIISDDAMVFFPVVKLMLNTILSFRLKNHPCLMLDEEHIRFFHERKAAIMRKRDCLAGLENEGERQLVNHTIRLIEQETMLEFILLYYRNCIVEPEPLDKKDAVAFQFVYSLHTHIKAHHNVSFYAGKANLSQSHFTRIVKEKTGKTPSEWIADVTILNAKLMLGQTDMSVKEIASELNFPEQFTFRKFFKHHVGIPPREYRRQNRE